MKRLRRWQVVTAGIGLGLATASGCQTWVPQAGLTLPTPRYLNHQPQFIPPSPQFPLPKELASQEEAAAQQPQVAPRPLGP
jgi:hypothetical protein